ncbi:MAG: DNA internalization-related competence protein ComEC/Rec2 [Endomicrobiales bacterium]|nr:DNA internalization-related competence protein ComEC/Rec2 [Endomicrobiales bacterium]
MLIIIDARGGLDPKIVATPGAEPSLFEAVVTSFPENKPNRASFAAKITAINGEKASFKALIVLRDLSTGIFPGDTLEITGNGYFPPPKMNPGGFDYRKYLLRKGFSSIIYPREVRVIGSKKLSFAKRAAYALRKSITSVLKKHVPEKEAEIVVPMVVGDDSEISETVKKSFTDSGLMHILVVSGLNVGYCAVIFFFLFRAFGLPRQWASALSLPFIGLYVLVAGANPPVLRAGVMAFFVIISLSLKREPLIYQSLSLAALFIMIFDPQALFMASFQLSFAATVGIVYFYPRLAKPFANLPFIARRFLVDVIAVSLSAQLAVLPFIAFYFNKISLAGLISNLIAVPFAGLVTASGLALYALSFIWGGFAVFAGLIAEYLAKILILTAETFSGFSMSTINVPAPGVLTFACYYAFIAAVFQIKKNRAALLCAVISGLFLIIPSAVGKIRSMGALEATFLDVGNSDCIHLRLPSGSDWLVDCGNSLGYLRNSASRTVIPYLRSRGIKRIDRIFITHPHFPHYSGIFEILDAFKAGEVVVNPDLSEETDYLKLFEKLQDLNVRVKEAWAGDVFKSGGVTAEILAPETLFKEKDDNSLVIMVAFGGNRMLLTGDMGSKEEKRLTESFKNLKAQVLHVPNHGARNFSGGFLKKVGAEYFIISSRRSDPKVLCSIKKENAFITGVSGAVNIVFKQGGIRLKTYKPGATGPSGGS